MIEKPSISYERSTVSIDDDISKKAKNFAKENVMKFSNLVEVALDHYLSNQSDRIPDRFSEDCFCYLVHVFCDAETETLADESVHSYGDKSGKEINQSHLLAHVLKEAVSAMSQLKDGQDWHDIKFSLPAQGAHGPKPTTHDPQLEADKAELEAEIDRSILASKKTG